MTDQFIVGLILTVIAVALSAGLDACHRRRAKVASRRLTEADVQRRIEADLKIVESAEKNDDVRGHLDPKAWPELVCRLKEQGSPCVGAAEHYSKKLAEVVARLNSRHIKSMARELAAAGQALLQQLEDPRK